MGYSEGCSLGRLSKMTRKDGSIVEWTWDALSMVEETDTREGDAAYFGGLAVERDGSWYYLMMDAMGTVFQVTDEAGQVVNSFDWDSWGNELSGTFSDGSAVCQTGWQGKRWDSDQGIFYSVARWYDQRTGRFTQPDPAEGARMVTNGGQAYGWPSCDPISSRDAAGLSEHYPTAVPRPTPAPSPAATPPPYLPPTIGPRTAPPTPIPTPTPTRHYPPSYTDVFVPPEHDGVWECCVKDCLFDHDCDYVGNTYWGIGTAATLIGIGAAYFGAIPVTGAASLVDLGAGLLSKDCVRKCCEDLCDYKLGTYYQRPNY